MIDAALHEVEQAEKEADEILKQAEQQSRKAVAEAQQFAEASLRQRKDAFRREAQSRR